jgi:Rrf2 family nitric oxide-sensitive transcriptional repressor
MRLTRYTDYAMRTLLHLGTRPDTVCSIAEIARAYGISQNHLMKVVNDLGRAGFVTSLRGRSGGIRLARQPAEISVGAVVRHMEADFALADCPDCVIAPACGLSAVFDEAVRAFLSVLDRASLADLLGQRAAALRGLLALPG